MLRLRGLLAAGLLVVLPQAALALDPNRNLSQYVRDRWGTQHGFPRGPVYSIEQTTDGYLWIGTEKGLVRFDGLNFVVVDSSQPSLGPLTHVLGLLADRNGGLWARLRRDVLPQLRYEGRSFQEAVTMLKKRSVSAMARDKDGNPLLWVLDGEPSAIRLSEGKVETIPAPAGFSRSPVLSLAQTSDGDIWVGTRDAGLFRIKDGVTSPVKGLPDLKVNALSSAGNELWVGTDAGLARWDGSKLNTDRIPQSLRGVQILAMTLDRRANLWVGTNSQGLMRLNATGLAWMDKPDNRPREAITAVFEDREGNLWTGSASGLERIRDSVFVTYSSAEGLPSDSSGPIFVDSSNSAWFAPMDGGLWCLRDGRLEEVKEAGLSKDVVYSISGAKDGLWIGRQSGGLTHLRSNSIGYQAQTYKMSDGLPQNSVYSVYESRDGAVWAGTLSGGVTRLHNGKFLTYTSKDGLASNTVASILEDLHGATWFATPNGLSALANGQWRTYTANDGLPSENVNSLLEDSTGVLWIGTSTGIAFKRGGRIQAPANTPDFLREQILGLAEDSTGELWIATATHVLRVKREALMNGRIADRDLREYTIADGLRGIEGVKRHQSVAKDSLGRIWFSLNWGISVVNPQFSGASSAPAIAQIQTMAADGKQVHIEDGLRIGGGSQRIVFGYAGLSLSLPGRVRFRYWLEGFDSGWSAPVTTREAAYTNLGPGGYRFRVIASNPDGEWSSSESTIAFQIAPLIWQTWWFQFGAVLVLASTIAAMYRLRLLQMSRRLNLRFEERLAERTRIAQELHDTLLQGFLSASMQLHVANDRLPEDSPVKPSMSRVLGLMGRVIEEGRNAVRGLRATDKDAEDLSQLFAHMQEEAAGLGEPCDFRVIVEGEPRVLHPVIRDEVHRIGREALVNAFRHSLAKNIEIELAYLPNRFSMSIRDNGCGIDPSVLRLGREGHWGLSGMRERAERIGANLHVRSRSTAGTEVELAIPGPVAFPDQARNGLLGRVLRNYIGGTK